MATNKKTGVHIEGLNAVVKSLEKMGIELQDLKTAFNKVGNRVADDAKKNVHSKTGSLASTIRASKSKNKAIIRAGSAKVLYAGVQEYGGYNNIEPQEFMQKAAESNQGAIVEMIDDEISSLIKQLRLK